MLALALCVGQLGAAGSRQVWAAHGQPCCEEGLCPRAPVVFSSTQCLQVAGRGTQHLLRAAAPQLCVILHVRSKFRQLPSCFQIRWQQTAKHFGIGGCNAVIFQIN